MSMTPRNHDSWHWIHRTTPKIPRNNPETFLTIINFWNLIISKSNFLETRRADKSLRSVLSIHDNLEYGINLFPKTCNGNLAFPNLVKGIPPIHLPSARSNQHSDSHPHIRVRLLFGFVLFVRVCVRSVWLPSGIRSQKTLRPFPISLMPFRAFPCPFPHPPKPPSQL